MLFVSVNFLSPDLKRFSPGLGRFPYQLTQKAVEKEEHLLERIKFQKKSWSV